MISNGVSLIRSLGSAGRGGGEACPETSSGGLVAAHGRCPRDPRQADVSARRPPRKSTENLKHADSGNIITLRPEGPRKLSGASYPVRTRLARAGTFFSWFRLAPMWLRRSKKSGCGWIDPRHGFRDSSIPEEAELAGEKKG